MLAVQWRASGIYWERTGKKHPEQWERRETPFEIGGETMSLLGFGDRCDKKLKLRGQ